MAPTDFSGKWKLDKAENLDAYLQEMGVNWMMRKVATSVGGKVSQTIVQDGDRFTITVSTPKGEFKEEFTVGEEFQTQMRPSDLKAKCIASWDGGKLQAEATMIDSKKAPHHITRELTSETEMVITVRVGDIVCKRFFKKQ